MLFLYLGLTYLLPVLTDSDVQNGFCTKLLKMMVSRSDVEEAHINCLVLDMHINSHSPHFDGSQIELAALLKRRFVNRELLHRLFNLGMQVREHDLLEAVKNLSESITGMSAVDVILANSSDLSSDSFQEALQAAKKAFKHQFASYLSRHAVKHESSDTETKVGSQCCRYKGL